MEEDLIKEVEEELLSNLLVDTGKIMLTSYEIEVLNKYHINYKSVLSLKELTFLIEEVLLEEDYPADLENISKNIAERDYYQNTNK